MCKIRSGGKDLKASGAYPWAYGHRVARLHTAYMAGKCEAHCDHRSASCDHQAILETGYQESWLGICDVCQYGFLALAVPVPPMPIEEPGNAWQCADLASLQKVIIEAAELRKFPLDPLIPVTIEPTEAVFKKYMEHHFPHIHH